jgi:hypothetical protein
MRMIAGLAGLAGMFLACGAAEAQAYVDRYDAKALTEIAKELGYSTIVDQADASNEDGPFLIFETENDGVFGFQGKACDNQTATAKCIGILFYGALSPPEDDDFDVLEYVNEYNFEYSAVKMVDEDGDLALSRYLIMDDGVSRANLKVNVQVFTSMYRKAQEELNKQ